VKKYKRVGLTNVLPCTVLGACIGNGPHCLVNIKLAIYKFLLHKDVKDCGGRLGFKAAVIQLQIKSI